MTTLRPFIAHVSDEALDDLRDRLARTRWPDAETVGDDSQGVRLAQLQELVAYWQSSYDWRAFEARLNAFPQIETDIVVATLDCVHASFRVDAGSGRRRSAQQSTGSAWADRLQFGPDYG